MVFKYREKLNLTQEELAAKAGISIRTIQRIEAGAIPKGHTLEALSSALGVSKEDLLVKSANERDKINYSLVKLINLSSLPFIVIPLVNIILPLALMYWKKEVNPLTKQIVSIQILWTILSAATVLISPFIKKWFLLSNQITVLTMLLALLVNLYIILRNTASIDRNKKLHIQLTFSFL